MVESKRSAKVIISGSSGLVGRALSSFLHTMGYEVLALQRGTQARSPHALFWDPSLRTKTDLRDWEGCEAFIHLAGAGIADKKWSSARKQELYDSRVVHTRALVSLLLRLKQPPRVFLSASAVGYYGNRADLRLTETASVGRGFLSHLCEQWEKAALLLLSRDIRIIHARFGAVLSQEGGILSKMTPLYNWGLGGVLGNGEQFLSWIALSDLVRAISFCLAFPQLRGAVNMVSPGAVKQREFASTLAGVLHRPCFLRLPQKLLELFLGEMADEVLLSSQKAFPEKLLLSGFSFQYPDLQSCLEQTLIPNTENKDIF